MQGMQRKLFLVFMHTEHLLMTSIPGVTAVAFTLETAPPRFGTPPIPSPTPPASVSDERDQERRDSCGAEEASERRERRGKRGGGMLWK